MHILIVEDEFSSRMQLKYFLEEYGECELAVNAEEAIQAFENAINNKRPHDIIFLDIKLPDRDGHEILSDIRRIEEELGKEKKATVIMSTALSDTKNIMSAFYGLCDDYLIKPIEKDKISYLIKKHIIG